LKNEGNLLPLDQTKVKTVAVIGPDAYPGQPVGGGSAGVRPFQVVSFLEGIANRAGENLRVTYAPGIPTLSDMAAATDFITDNSAKAEAGLRAERFLSDDLS